MKKLYYYHALSFLLVVLACACSGGDTDPIKYSFEVTKTPLSFNADADTKNIAVNAENISWTADVDNESKTWLSVVADIENGRAVVSVTANPLLSERNGKVIITPYGNLEPVEVAVTQNGSAKFTVNPPTLDFEAEDDSESPQTLTVTVTEGLEWDFEIEEEAQNWLFGERRNDNQIEVHVTAKTNKGERFGKITVSITNMDGFTAREVTVTQKGSEEPGELVLRAAQSEVTFTYESGQTRNVNVTAINVEWDFRIEGMTGNWMGVVKDPQGAQERLTFSILEENETHDPRTAKVILFGDGIEDFIIDVTQQGMPRPTTLEVETNEIVFEVGGATTVVGLTAYSMERLIVYTYGKRFEGPVEDWVTVTIADDWETVTLEVSPNNTDKPRYGEIWLGARGDRVNNVDDVCILIQQKNQHGELDGAQPDEIFNRATVGFVNRGQGYNYFGVSLAIHDETRDEDVYLLRVELWESETTINPSDFKIPEGVYTYLTRDVQYFSNLHVSRIYEDGSNDGTYFGNRDNGETITVSYVGDDLRLEIRSNTLNKIPCYYFYQGPVTYYLIP